MWISLPDKPAEVVDLMEHLRNSREGAAAPRPATRHRTGTRASDRLPANIDVATVSTGSERRPHLIGGSLKTLLYTAQLAAISQDPWFSTIANVDLRMKSVGDLRKKLRSANGADLRTLTKTLKK